MATETVVGGYSQFNRFMRRISRPLPKKGNKKPNGIVYPPRIRGLEKNAIGFFVALFGETA
jgi:hypothetical protein